MRFIMKFNCSTFHSVIDETGSMLREICDRERVNLRRRGALNPGFRAEIAQTVAEGAANGACVSRRVCTCGGPYCMHPLARMHLRDTCRAPVGEKMGTVALPRQNFREHPWNKFPRYFYLGRAVSFLLAVAEPRAKLYRDSSRTASRISRR